MIVWLTAMVFLLLLVWGLPIAYVVLGSSLVYFFSSPMSFSVLAQRLVSSLDSFPLLAVPFFIVAGTLMVRGGIADRLYALAEAVVGHWRGGLAQVAVANSLLVGAMSGSAIADAAIDARTLVPIMRKNGYSNGFASAISAASGLIAPVMPPSIALIIFGVLTSTSIAKLFIGGVIPAILMAVVMMLTIRVIAVRRGYTATRDKRAPLADIARLTLQASFALLMPVLLLVGLRIGWFTPTELGAIAAAYAFVVGLFVYRGFGWRDLWGILRESAHTTGSVMIIIAASAVFSVVLTLEGAPQFVVSLLLSLTENKYIALLLVNVALLVIGMVIESLSLMLILAPIMIATMRQYGIDPVHFGVVIVINLAIGSITPPVGTVMYTVCSITKCSIEQISRELFPFIVALFALLVVIALVPAIVTFLPNLLF